jgi:hypothetical protein
MRFNKRYQQICFFCGLRGNHKHHVDPRAASGKDYFQGIEYVYSCNECNSAINDNIFYYIHEEVEFLIDYYEDKYKLNKPVVEWSDEEINELGVELKQRIKKHLALRRKNEDRWLYLKSLRNYLIVDEDM